MPELRRQEVDYSGWRERGQPSSSKHARCAVCLTMCSRERTRRSRYGIGVGRAGLRLERRCDGRTQGRVAGLRLRRRNMIRRDPRNRRFAGGVPAEGLNSPLGARALYLYRGGRDTMFRIHGTKPAELHRPRCLERLRAHAEPRCDRPLRSRKRRHTRGRDPGLIASALPPPSSPATHRPFGQPALENGMRLGGRLAAAIEVLDDIAQRRTADGRCAQGLGSVAPLRRFGRPRRDRQHRLRCAAPQTFGRLAVRRRHAARAGFRRVAAGMERDAGRPERRARRRPLRAAATDSGRNPSRHHAPAWRCAGRPSAPTSPTGACRSSKAPSATPGSSEAAGLAQRPPLDLRVNTLNANRARILTELSGVGAAPTALAPQGIRIPPIDGSGRHPNVQAEPAFQKGWFEVQDEGSQIVSALAGATAGMQVLDYCAGAGGKTLALVGDDGEQGPDLRLRFREGEACADLRPSAALRQSQRPGRRQAARTRAARGPDGHRAGRRALHRLRHMAQASRRQMAAAAKSSSASAWPSRAPSSTRPQPM